MGEDASLGACDALLVGILVVELEEEEFLELEACARLVELFAAVGVMDGCQGLLAAHEAEVVENLLGEILLEVRGER